MYPTSTATTIFLGDKRSINSKFHFLPNARNSVGTAPGACYFFPLPRSPACLCLPPPRSPPGNGRTCHINLHLVGNLQLHRSIPEAHDRTVNAASWSLHDLPSSGCRASPEASCAAAIAAADQEIPDGEQGSEKEKQLGQARPDEPGSAARRIGFTKRHSIKVGPFFLRDFKDEKPARKVRDFLGSGFPDSLRVMRAVLKRFPSASYGGIPRTLQTGETASFCAWCQGKSGDCDAWPGSAPAFRRSQKGGEGSGANSAGTRRRCRPGPEAPSSRA